MRRTYTYKRNISVFYHQRSGRGFILAIEQIVRLITQIIKRLRTIIEKISGTYKTPLEESKHRAMVDLSITKEELSNWKPIFIENIDSENNTIYLKTKSDKTINLRIDNFTMRNLKIGIVETHFKHKYGKEYQYEIDSYSYPIPSKYEVDGFSINLRTKLKKKNQTTSKRKRMYHKYKVDCSKFFVVELLKTTNI